MNHLVFVGVQQRRDETLLFHNYVKDGPNVKKKWRHHFMCLFIPFSFPFKIQTHPLVWSLLGQNSSSSTSPLEFWRTLVVLPEYFFVEFVFGVGVCWLCIISAYEACLFLCMYVFFLSFCSIFFHTCSQFSLLYLFGIFLNVFFELAPFVKLQHVSPMLWAVLARLLLSVHSSFQTLNLHVKKFSPNYILFLLFGSH